MSQTEVAGWLGADYVIEATVTGLSLYEAGTGKLMYQAREPSPPWSTTWAAGKMNSDYFVNASWRRSPATLCRPLSATSISSRSAPSMPRY